MKSRSEFQPRTEKQGFNVADRLFEKRLFGGLTGWFDLFIHDAKMRSQYYGIIG
jgi:hypothetical protein